MYGVAMTNPKSVRMLSAVLEGTDGLLVTFSDGTTAGYLVEELLDLRPCRELTPPFATKISADSLRPLFSQGPSAGHRVTDSQVPIAMRSATPHAAAT